MPPDLDLYVISPLRNSEAIERFLRLYVDRAASADRGDEELMMLPLNAAVSPSRMEEWENLPVRTLNEIVEVGLRRPSRAFSAYLTALDSSLTRATLGFTCDDRVIFGLSLDDEGAKAENLMRAKMLLHELAREFDAEGGFIGVEEPSPIAGKIPSHSLIVYAWQPDRKAFRRILNRKGGEPPRPDDSID